MAYKKSNDRTTCVLIYRPDINSKDYYPSYYTNKKAANRLHEFLVSKYLVDHDNKVTNLIVFTQSQPLVDYLHKVWRVSCNYDSLLFKLGKHMPKVISFPEPEEGVSKINTNNNHFQWLEVVNGLNGCLEVEDQVLFQLESDYSGVFTKYMHYALCKNM